MLSVICSHRCDARGRPDRPGGATFWYKSGILHRENGPAIERADGTREWYAEGTRHCETGPAFISADGERHWFVHGKELTEAEFDEMRRRIIEEIGEAFIKGTTRKTSIFPDPLKRKP